MRLEFERHPNGWWIEKDWLRSVTNITKSVYIIRYSHIRRDLEAILLAVEKKNETDR